MCSLQFHKFLFYSVNACKLYYSINYETFVVGMYMLMPSKVNSCISLFV